VCRQAQPVRRTEKSGPRITLAATPELGRALANRMRRTFSTYGNIELQLTAAAAEG